MNYKVKRTLVILINVADRFKKIFIPIILILVISYVVVTILENTPVKYDIITLEEEPKGIYSSPYSSELTVVYDDKIILYNESGDMKKYNINLPISHMAPIDDYAWIIDDDKNMYKLTYESDTEFEISDIILTDITYLDASRDAFGAVTSNGELYVYGDNECGWLGLDGESYISEPTKVGYMTDVTKFVFSNGMSSVLTTQGEVYSAGRIDAYDLNNEYYSKYIYEFTKDEALTDVKDIYGCDYLYSIYEDDDIVCSYGYSYSESDNKYIFRLNEEISDKCVKDSIKLFSAGMKYTLGLNDSGEVYYWGYDFLFEAKVKSDNYSWIPSPVRLTNMDGIDMVYGAMEVAYFKKGLDIYIIK